MSISKSQALAISDGFIDSIGEGDPGDLDPRESFSEIILLAGEFIEDAQHNLEANNSNASGALSNSLVAEDPKLDGGVMSINVMMNFYGLFVNKGVKGTKSGAGDYSFKNDKPSQKMVKAIEDWIGKRRLSSVNVNSSKTIFKSEKKSASVSSLNKAYAVARAIKQHGIKATGFLDKAVNTTSDKVADRLSAAFSIDIINSITL